MTDNTSSTEEADGTQPPIGWDGKRLKEMLNESERRFDETDRYYGLDELDLKESAPFEYEQLYSRLRGALVSARETAMHISASPIVREIGEVCFQFYTPEGDCVALSTGIIVHVHTGSLAIKYMIDQDYEERPGIEPGDIFCNNDNSIGNVHTADLHTIIPIFYEGELIGWADGVTHEIDIGGTSRGGLLVSATNRYDDGLYATCEKVGDNDEFYPHWKDRAQRGVRTPKYFDLDEKCRLAGCHMVRDAVHDIIDDVGVDRFKQFMRESIEEGRRLLHERSKLWLFPGTYRDVSFLSIPFEHEAWKPTAQVNMVNHMPVEMTVKPSGEIKMDTEGASPTGPHPYNAAEGSMTGGLWVSLAQCLLNDGKINDGSHLALDTNFQPGTITNFSDVSVSSSASWGTITFAYNAFWKNLSRGFFARGYVEEVVSGFGHTTDTYYGGGRLDSGEYYPVGSVENNSGSLGASAVRDGLDWAYALWNPESDMGDVEEWETTEKGFMYLARRAKPNTAGHGKYRGGSGWEGLRTVIDSYDFSVAKQLFPGVAWPTSGMSGGYPGARNYTVRARDTDLPERFNSKNPYPIGDSPPGELDEYVDGDITRQEWGTTYPKSLDNYDLFYYQEEGAPGFGDPLDRSLARVKEDAEDRIFTPDVIEDVYGVVGEFDEAGKEFVVDFEATERRQSELRDRRGTEAQPYDEFWEADRRRLVDDEPEISDPVKRMYDGVFEASEEWGEFFREFWELPDDFRFDKTRQPTSTGGEMEGDS
jgi:N-methylhydantoinase B/oxoprolinase/acetone carboxylase alpha subunit